MAYKHTATSDGVYEQLKEQISKINSDMLGLSQLYQLKGRIGRSDKESFAYFTFRFIQN